PGTRRGGRGRSGGSRARRRSSRGGWSRVVPGSARIGGARGPYPPRAPAHPPSPGRAGSQTPTPRPAGGKDPAPPPTRTEKGPPPAPSGAGVLLTLRPATIILAGVGSALRARGPRTLKQRCGRESARVTADTDSRRHAEAELADRQERREQLDIRPL